MLDTGIQETLRQMEARVGRSRMVAKLRGGARMFEWRAAEAWGNIGQRILLKAYI